MNQSKSSLVFQLDTRVYSDVKCILVFLSLFIASTTLTSQSRSELESSRMQLLEAIEKTEKDLTYVSKTKEKLLREIDRIRTEAANQDELDENSLRLQELNFTEDTPIEEEQEKEFLAEVNEEEIQLEEKALVSDDYTELLQLQEEMLREKVRSDRLHPAGYKQPNDLLDAMIRDRHLHQLTAHVNSLQLENSPTTTTTKEISILSEDNTISELPVAVAEPVEQSKIPSKDINALNQKLADLTDRETRIKLYQLSLRQKQDQLNNQMDQLLRSTANFSSTTSQVVTPEAVNLSSVATTTGLPSALTVSNYDNVNGLSRKKGFLPWPMKGARVKERIGSQVRGLKIASSSTDVISIFAGVVEKINTTTAGQSVTIKHDDNSKTVYSGLSSTLVTVDQQVNQNDQLGSCQGVLHFELWQNNSAQNPLHWLKNN